MARQFDITLRHANEEERARYWQLREQPALYDAMCKGATMAEDWLLPRIADGRATFQAGALARNVDGFLQAGLTDFASEKRRRLTDDERFMFRTGYEAVALPAKEAAEGDVTGIGPMPALPPQPAGNVLLFRGAVARPRRLAGFGTLPLPPGVA